MGIDLIEDGYFLTALNTGASPLIGATSWLRSSQPELELSHSTSSCLYQVKVKRLSLFAVMLEMYNLLNALSEDTGLLRMRVPFLPQDGGQLQQVATGAAGHMHDQVEEAFLPILQLFIVDPLNAIILFIFIRAT